MKTKGLVAIFEADNQLNMTEEQFKVLSLAIELQKKQSFNFQQPHFFWQKHCEDFDFGNKSFHDSFNHLFISEFIIRSENGTIGEFIVPEKGLKAFYQEEETRKRKEEDITLSRQSLKSGIDAPQKANKIAKLALGFAALSSILAFIALTKDEQAADTNDFVTKDMLKDYVTNDKLESYSDSTIIDLLDHIYSDSKLKIKK